MANVLHKAAAHSNGVCVACADRVGVERGQPFIGRSLIVGPDGLTIAGPPARTEPEMPLVEADPGRIATARQITVHLVILGPLFLDRFAINVLTRSMIFAILAIAVDLLWGFTGIPTFGQAAFFGADTRARVMDHLQS